MTPKSFWQERYMRNHRHGRVVDGHADLRGDNEITLSRLSGMAVGLRQ